MKKIIINIISLILIVCLFGLCVYLICRPEVVLNIVGIVYLSWWALNILRGNCWRKKIEFTIKKFLATLSLRLTK